MTASRAAFMTLGQLAFYDKFKILLINSGGFEDKPLTHMIASSSAVSNSLKNIHFIHFQVIFILVNINWCMFVIVNIKYFLNLDQKTGIVHSCNRKLQSCKIVDQSVINNFWFDEGQQVAEVHINLCLITDCSDYNCICLSNLLYLLLSFCYYVVVNYFFIKKLSNYYSVISIKSLWVRIQTK